MPVLKDFGSFQIRMYFKDHDPPHVHVEAAGFRALVSIDDGNVLMGRIDPKFRRQALDWIAAHRDELFQAWTELQK